MHEENDAAPAHKRMRRKQPPNSALQHHEHYSHRGQQRRKDMGCSAQGVQLHAPRIHRCIGNEVQLNSFSIADFDSRHDSR